ncbi:hypothetical protein NU10_11740 [Flavobacterium dauae]|uniref:hypothetical protein n=1 Tax=Flavobacterium dauae TaxID=1563479 RepID=UPI00101B4797|nr:hypothetical protein [Flavobacterium dauae]WLD23374.1 hypothetical protein NU10_11740 [Flavobacterium dauae]
MKKLLFLMLFTCLGLGMQAQGLNAKYVQMKKVYNFQEEFNEYRVNSFLKHKLEEAGYTVFYDDQELPQEVKADPCKLLKCNVERDKSMLATKLQITLVNCKSQTVFTANGESRLKKRDKSHVDALKNALEYSVLNKK